LGLADGIAFTNGMPDLLVDTCLLLAALRLSCRHLVRATVISDAGRAVHGVVGRRAGTRKPVVTWFIDVNACRIHPLLNGGTSP
jgi:hypothetical protein